MASSMGQIEQAMDEQPMLKEMDMATMMSMFSSGNSPQAKLMKDKLKVFESMGLDMGQMTMADMVSAMKNKEGREDLLKKKMKLDTLTPEQKKKARAAAPIIKDIEKREDEHLGLIDEEGHDVADAVVDASGNQVTSKKRRRRLARKQNKMKPEEYKDMFGSMTLGKVEKMSKMMSKSPAEIAKLEKMRQDLAGPLEKLDLKYDEITMDELAELMKDPKNEEIFKDVEGYKNPSAVMAEARAEDEATVDPAEDDEIMEML